MERVRSGLELGHDKELELEHDKVLELERGMGLGLGDKELEVQLGWQQRKLQ